MLNDDDLKVWREGSKVAVVDCVSPFNPGERFVEMFLAETRMEASK